MRHPSRRWLEGSLLCGAPVVGGLGGGATGVPIAHGPASWALLGGVGVALAVATAWLMRRWSRPAGGAAGDRAQARSDDLDPRFAADLARIEAEVTEEAEGTGKGASHAIAEREPALR